MSESTTTHQLSAQWTNPSDVLSLLLIIGGDIVQTALAQTAGGWITPVCFSFGWVAYSFSTLVHVLGDGRLLPPPDFPVKVFNLKTSYVRENKNWVVGRILRDNELFLNKKHQHAGNGIRISIYRALGRELGQETKNLSTERLWVLVTLLQIGISAIPLGLDGEWGVFLVTCSGIAASFLAGALPQWRIEKVPIKRQSRSHIALTSGNASRDIMIIFGAGQALDLEELSAGESPRCDRIWESIRLFSDPVKPQGDKLSTYSDNKRRRKTKMYNGLPVGLWFTRIATFCQVVFWLALLITVAGLKSHSWYLVAVGSVGMLQNAMLAAAARRPDRRGLPLECVDIIMTNKVMDGLMDLEATISGAGQLLRYEFFPGALREDEESWWTGIVQQPRNQKRLEPYDAKRIKQPHRGRPRSMLPKKPIDIPDIDFSANAALDRTASTVQSSLFEMADYTPVSVAFPDRVVEMRAERPIRDPELHRPPRNISSTLVRGVHPIDRVGSPDFV